MSFQNPGPQRTAIAIRIIKELMEEKYEKIGAGERIYATVTKNRER